MLEDAHKKAQREQLPIPDVTLVDIATKLILQDQAFTPKMKKWEEKRPVDKTWTLWKSTFPETHKGLQRQIQACGGANQFGSANSASVESNTSSHITDAPPDIFDKINDYMDNMDNAVTN